MILNKEEAYLRGVNAARFGKKFEACPYSHKDLRALWREGFKVEQGSQAIHREKIDRRSPAIRHEETKWADTISGPGGDARA